MLIFKETILMVTGDDVKAVSGERAKQAFGKLGRDQVQKGPSEDIWSYVVGDMFIRIKIKKNGQ